MGLFSSSKSSTTNLNTSANLPQQSEDNARNYGFANVEGPINIESLDPVLVGDVLAFSDRSLDMGYTFAAGATREALISNERANDGALEFSAGAFQSALSAISNATENGAALSSELVNLGFEDIDRARMFSAGVLQEALEANQFASSEALGIVDQQSERANDVVALAFLNQDKGAERNAQFLGGAFSATVDALAESGRSETAQITQQALYAVVALGTAMLIFGRG